MSEELYQKIYKYGKYYNPATSHYSNDNGVYCDRCKTANLSSCIGYEDSDLCLSCVARVEQVIKIKKSREILTTPICEEDNLTFMLQDIYRPSPKPPLTRLSKLPSFTKMKQRMFTDYHSEVTTMMQQSMFRNPPSEQITTNMQQSMFRNPPSDATKTYMQQNMFNWSQMNPEMWSPTRPK